MLKKPKRVYVARRNTNNYKYSNQDIKMGTSKDVIKSAKVNSNQADISIRLTRKYPELSAKGHISELDRRHMIVITPSGERLHYVRGRQIPKKKTSARVY
jgi:hypothetical protein